MSWFLLLTCAGLCGLTSGCSTTPHESASQPVQPVPFDSTLVSPDILDLHGQERLVVLLYPDRVHTYLTEKVYDRVRSEKAWLANDYRVITQGPDLSAKQIDHLRRLYIDMRGYGRLSDRELDRYFPPDPLWGMRLYGSGCEWKPDVVLEYRRGNESIRVVICFGCSMWAFENSGKYYAQFGFAKDQRASGLQPMLRHTTIELFPEMMNYIPRHR